MKTIGLVLAAVLLAAPVLASPLPMAQDKHINDQLRAGFAGDILRKTCPAIQARMLVVIGRLYDLKSYAEAQGYTAADYDAFRKDPAQKARLKTEAEAYAQLRQMAMAWSISFEDAALRVVARHGTEGRDDQRSRG